MNDENRNEFGAAAERLAAMAAEALERQLADPEGDVKKAKDLSGIFKDMAGLAQQLRGGEARDLTVIFAGGAEDAAI